MMAREDRRLLGKVKEEIGGSVHAFICTSSYEDRCLSIPLQISQEIIQHAVILENTDIQEVRENANRLREHFGCCARQLDVKMGQPIASVDAMHDCLKEIISGEELDHVAIDITTFTHEQLLILLGLLRRMGCTTVLCLYSGAAAYMTGEKQWLSEGIADIRSVLGFSGDLGIRSGLKLVMLVGFEWERARRLIDAYDPTKLVLGLGRRSDAIEDAHYETNERCFNELAKHYPDATTFEFSCTDAVATAEIIGEQCGEEDFTPVVAPLNTKISTVGSALAAFADPRIQLCYAQAEIYNCVSYSRPGEFFRAFRIDLPQGG